MGSDEFVEQCVGVGHGVVVFAPTLSCVEILSVCVCICGPSLCRCFRVICVVGFVMLILVCICFVWSNMGVFV